MRKKKRKNKNKKKTQMQKKHAPSNRFPSFVSIASEEFAELPLEVQVRTIAREVVDLKRRLREVELAYLEVKEDEEDEDDEEEMISLNSQTDEYLPPKKIIKFL